jgi:hypothetical protein
MELTANIEYQNLPGRIANSYTQGRIRAHQAVNTELIETNWQIGQNIVEFEQRGSVKAEYGKALLTNISAEI